MKQYPNMRSPSWSSSYCVLPTVLLVFAIIFVVHKRSVLQTLDNVQAHVNSFVKSENRSMEEPNTITNPGGLNILSYPDRATFKNTFTCVLSASTPTFQICLHKGDKQIASDIISDWIEKGELWEPEIQTAIHKELNMCPNCQVIDIGAMMGTHALLSAALGRRVVAVEPLSANYNRIMQSVVLNGFQDRFVLLANGISDKRGMTEIYVPSHNIGSTRLRIESVAKPSGTVVTENVTLITLDDLIPLFNPAQELLIKIDVESFECHVIKGGQNFLRQMNVRQLYVEMQWVTIGKEEVDMNCVKDMVDILIEQGYKCFTMDGKKELEMPIASRQQWPWDVLWKKGV